MAKFIICDECKKLIEYKVETEYKYGMTFSKLTCPLCGHVKEVNKSHVHYGEDGKR